MINKCENAGIKNLIDPSAFIEYANNMGDICNNIDHCSPKRKSSILIVFDDLTVDIKRFQAIIKELFISCRKLNISLIFIRQCYFIVPKEVILNLTHYLIMKIHNKRKLQQVTINHSANIVYKYFYKYLQKLYKRTFFYY